MADSKRIPLPNHGSPASLAPSKLLSGEGVLDALKMMLIGAPLDEVLTSVTRLIEAQSDGMLCSIFLVDKDGLHLRYGAAPSLPESYRVATDGIAIGPNAGSCGTAVYRREPVFVADILSDPLWVKFRESATILDWPARPGDPYRVLRKGTSEWSCLPGVPGYPPLPTRAGNRHTIR
jgi:hypothetical protein